MLYVNYMVSAIKENKKTKQSKLQMKDLEKLLK